MGWLANLEEWPWPPTGATIGLEHQLVLCGSACGLVRQTKGFLADIAVVMETAATVCKQPEKQQVLVAAEEVSNIQVAQ